MLLADLHIHSCYSRATSRDCVPEMLDLWARRKGLSLLGTGDFTHPAWRQELSEKLEPTGNGFYTLRREFRFPDAPDVEASGPYFTVTGEISSIYKKNGRVRKVHSLLILPSLEDAEALSHRLEAIGNLHSDGRPILGLDTRDLLEIMLDTCPGAIFVPAHIWTPHFSLFGAFSGFDAIEECFEDLTPHITALETGLSSDPPMIRRLSALDRFHLISNSDAHSPAKLGREANLLEIEPSYPALAKALATGEGLSGTVEFFPEEGKYHFDGHRNCGICLSPAEAEEQNGICPVCGRKLTTGVLHRVEQLADRPETFTFPGAKPFESLVPLPEIIAVSTGYSVACARTENQYLSMLRNLGPEFRILRELPLENISREAGPCITEGIRRLREGRVQCSPGFDGEYGKITLLTGEEIRAFSGQMSFFQGKEASVGKPAKKAAARKPSARAKTDAPAPAAPESGPLSGLNPEQLAAVTAKGSATAVIAGPGTGKTKTLTARIVWLVETCGVPPSSITAVTFTNKAAAEMRQRLEASFGSKRTVSAMTIGTFHSICLKLLGEVSLLDESEALTIAEDVLRELGQKTSPRQLLQEVSRIKNTVPYPPDSPSEAVLRYCARLKQDNLLDFDDLLSEVLRRLADSSPDSRFSHLLVDEFQDINDVQYRLISAWSRGGQSLFVIGDPDQAIYGFRGSDARCFERLAADIPGLETIRLVRNYRSTPEILESALPVIARNPGPERRLEAQHPAGTPVRLVRAPDDFSEAVFLAKEINRMVGGVDMLDAHSALSSAERPPRGFSDIAILYRTHRQAEVLEKCLTIEGIPYLVTGRDPSLSDRAVRGTLGFFRNLLRPSDAVSLRACLQILFRCPEQTARAFAALLPSQRALPLPDSLSAETALLRWQELAAAYAPRLSREKPRKLLEIWMEEMSLSGSIPMEKLLNTAILHPDMPSLLRTLNLGEEGDISRSGGKHYTSDAVTLMTLHGAKGLEFPVVFLCGCARSVLPLDMPGRISEREEERRLFYVGLTRAKEELILTAPGEPSPFLADIPSGSLLQSSVRPLRPLPEAKQLTLF